MAGQPTWLLSRANARAQAILRDAFEAEGFRGYHFRLLAALDEHGPARQAELGRYTGIDPSDVVATLNELVDGVLARPADRRRNSVLITAPGAEVLERLDTVPARVQEQVLEPLTARERTALARSLSKLG